jgi:hypothetical protein
MKKIFVTFVVALIATFAMAQNKSEIKPTDLPKKVTDYVSQNMKGFTIEKAYKVENKGEVSYAVIVMKGTEKHKMHFDKDGTFIKSIAPAEDMKTEGAPATKTTNQVPVKQPPVAKPSSVTKSQPTK